MFGSREGMMADSALTQSIIAALSGLLGTIIGGCISYWAQVGQANAEQKRRRKMIALSLAAEIEAYLELMKRRNHSASGRQLAAAIRAGQNVEIRGFALSDDTPLGQFPLFSMLMGEVGELGAICADLAKFHALIVGVRTTAIAAERGQYDRLSATAKADLIESELALWESALPMGEALIPRLRMIAEED
jgi:hypothetical protein